MGLLRRSPRRSSTYCPPTQLNQSQFQPRIESDPDMADDETSSNTSMKGDEAFAQRKAGINKDELNEHLREYINEWKKQRSKDEDELKRLKEKQMKRKEIRLEQEKKLNQQKKLEEEKLKKEEAEKRALLEEAKKRKMEDDERRRQEANEGGKGKGKGPVIDAHKEISKTKEQVEEEMKISLSFRIKPLDLEGMDSDELKAKATDLFNMILLLETEKYDCEQRRLNQDYELKELKERQKLHLRQKAAKKGLDPDAYTGKYPPKIRMFSKYERRTDTRSYSDRKGLYEGGWDVARQEYLEAQFKEKSDEWAKRTKQKLPKWFGERPGKKAGDPETPEGEEEEVTAAAAEEEYEEEEEEEEDEEEE